MRCSFAPQVVALYELAKIRQAAVGEVMQSRTFFGPTFHGTKSYVASQELFIHFFVSETHRLTLLDRLMFVNRKVFNLISKNSKRTMSFWQK